MYDIGISEITITDKLEDSDHRSIKFMAQAANRPKACPNPDCKDAAIPTKHDSSQYLLHDVKTEGKLAFIDLKVQRYKCSCCGAVFADEFRFYRKRQHMTNRLKDEIVERCIKGETFRYIANDYMLDSKTVAAVFKEYAEAHKDELTNEYTPEVLGIDEAHIDDHYRLVLTDIVQQRLLDIKPDNKARTVKAYLRTLDKDICRCATMDFAPAYATAMKTILPDVTVVIDKFHAVQEVNRCLDNARRALQNRLRDEYGIDPRIFKRARYLFLTNWEDLTVDGATRLSEWFGEYPDLYDAYMCKETFRDIYITADDRVEATVMFDEWLDSVPPFAQFEAMHKTMTKRREHILNYWDYRWTNAYTESVNNAIKKIEKAGRGYKFKTLRERCLLEINRPKPEKFNPREASYTSVMMNLSNVAEDAAAVSKYMKLSKIENADEIGVDFAFRLHDCLEIYFETHSSAARQRQSQQERLQHYHDKLKALTGK